MKWFPYLALLIAGLNSGCDQNSSAAGLADGENVSATAMPEKVAFNAHIRPIFSDTCFHCHGFDAKAREAGMRLDIREEALKKNKDGSAPIVPGKPDASPLIRMVTDQVEDLEMPPLGKRAKYPALTKDEIAKLSGWIAQGANWPESVTLRAPGK